MHVVGKHGAQYRERAVLRPVHPFLMVFAIQRKGEEEERGGGEGGGGGGGGGGGRGGREKWTFFPMIRSIRVPDQRRQAEGEREGFFFLSSPDETPCISQIRPSLAWLGLEGGEGAGEEGKGASFSIS